MGLERREEVPEMETECDADGGEGDGAGVRGDEFGEPWTGFGAAIGMTVSPGCC